jgi:hypothetical protein
MIELLKTLATNPLSTNLGFMAAVLALGFLVLVATR